MQKKIHKNIFKIKNDDELIDADFFSYLFINDDFDTIYFLLYFFFWLNQSLHIRFSILGCVSMCAHHAHVYDEYFIHISAWIFANNKKMYVPFGSLLRLGRKRDTTANGKQRKKNVSALAFALLISFVRYVFICTMHHAYVCCGAK